MADVLLCIRNPALANAVREAIGLLKSFRVTGVVSDRAALLAEIDHLTPQIAVLDTELLSGSEDIIDEIALRRPRTQILLMQSSLDEPFSGPASGWVGRHLPSVSLDASLDEWAEKLSGLRSRPGAWTVSKSAAWRRFSSLTWEVGALALISGLSFFISRDLFGGQFLLTGYADWVYHAYRIRSLQEYGFLNWSNDWNGGFPLWQSYQFIPHLITSLVVDLTGWPIPRMMVFLTGLLFIAFRLLVYGMLRAAHLSVASALVGAALTLPLVGYYGPLADFSLLWGLSLFPLVFLLFAEGKGLVRRIYLAALMAGLAVYVHPILAVLAGLMLVSGLLVMGRLLSRPSVLAFVLVLLASSFYWFPLLLGDKPAYVDEWVASGLWQRSTFPKRWLGLGLSQLVVIAATAVLIQRRVTLPSPNPRLLAVAALTLALAVGIVALAYFELVPNFVNLAQPARWMGFVGLCVAVLGAFAVESFRGRRLFPLVLPLLLLAISLDSFQVAAAELPRASPEMPASSALRCLEEAGGLSYGDRLVSRDTLVPELSFFAFGQVRMAGHYFGQGAYDLLYPTLKWLLFSGEPGSALERGDMALALSYMKAMGGTLLLVPEGEPIARALLPGGDLAGALPLQHRSKGYALFRVPGRQAQAFATSPEVAAGLGFPNTRYDTDEQRKLRDQLVGRFVEAIEGPETAIPRVSYPGQRQITVAFSNLPSQRYLIVLAQYDGSWQAQAGGRMLRVERNGPGYIGLDLSGLQGEVTVELVHETHWTWVAGATLVILSLPVALFLIWKEKGG